MRASKATPYEASIHVPFVVRWSDVIPEGRCVIFLWELLRLSSFLSVK